jgi:hypothetical protein
VPAVIGGVVRHARASGERSITGVLEEPSAKKSAIDSGSFTITMAIDCPPEAG